jgi:PAS domain S-box-containing protein
MIWEIQPTSVALLFAAGLSALVAGVAWRRRATPGGTAFAFMMMAVAGYALIVALESSAPGLDAKIILSRIEYFFIASSSPTFLIFVARYTRQDGWLTRRNGALLWISPVLTILSAWTNDWHGLLWGTAQPGVNMAGLLVYDHGWWFWVHILYSYVLMAAGTSMLVRAIARAPQVYRRQARVLLAGAAIPWIGSAIYSFGLSPVPGFDWSPITFALAGLIYAWGIFGLQLFELAPVARDALFEGLPDGVIVLDMQNRVADANPAAMRLLRLASQVIGAPVEQAFERYPELVEALQRAGADRTEVRLRSGAARHLDLRVTPLQERGRGVIGRFAVLHDITHRKTLEEKLRGSEALYRSIVSASPDGIAITDLRGIVKIASPEAVRVFDLAGEEEFVGRALLDFILPEDRGAADAVVRHLADGRRQGIHDFRAIKGGGVIDIEVHGEAIREPGGQASAIVFIVRDVSQRKRLEAELHLLNLNLERQVELRTQQLESTIRTLEYEIAGHKRAEDALRVMEETLAQRVADQSRKLAALYEVILVGGQSLGMQDMQEQSLAKIMAVVGGEAACMHLLEESSGVLRLAAHIGLRSEARELMERSPAAWLPADKIARTVMDLLMDTSAPPEIRLPGYRAYLGTRISLQGRPVGALSIFWSAPRSFPVEDIALFSAMADQLGIIVENARLRQRSADAAVLRERRRLARDLHDSVTQSLHSLVLSADTATNRLRQGKLDRLEHSLSQLAESARQALKEMRLLLFELRLASLDQVNLVEALQIRLDAVERRAGIDAQLIVDGPPAWPRAWEGEMYCIAMEALNNSLKYARATRVFVRLRGEAAAVDLEIGDNGLGFNAQTNPVGGMGLRNMAERAERLGGRLTISSEQGAGTRIQLCVDQTTPQAGAELASLEPLLSPMLAVPRDAQEL